MATLKETAKEAFKETISDFSDKKKYFKFALFVFFVFVIMFGSYIIHFVKANPELFENNETNYTAQGFNVSYDSNFTLEDYSVISSPSSSNRSSVSS